MRPRKALNERFMILEGNVERTGNIANYGSITRWSVTGLRLSKRQFPTVERSIKIKALTRHLGPGMQISSPFPFCGWTRVYIGLEIRIYVGARERKQSGRRNDKFTRSLTVSCLGLGNSLFLSATVKLHDPIIATAIGYSLCYYHYNYRDLLIARAMTGNSEFCYLYHSTRSSLYTYFWHFYNK